MMKRVLPVILVLSFVFGSLLNNFSVQAASNSKGTVGTTVYQKEIVYIEDDEGQLIPVEIEEITYIPADTGENVRDLTPRYPIGTTKTYSIKISNEMMGLPSLAGGAISLAAKKKATQAAASVITKKLGANFLPGVNLVSFILGAAAWANALTGKSGIIIKVTSKYKEHYLHKEGYYMYGWTPTSVRISRY